MASFHLTFEQEVQAKKQIKGVLIFEDLQIIFSGQMKNENQSNVTQFQMNYIQKQGLHMIQIELPSTNELKQQCNEQLNQHQSIIENINCLIEFLSQINCSENVHFIIDPINLINSQLARIVFSYFQKQLLFTFFKLDSFSKQGQQFKRPVNYKISILAKMQTTKLGKNLKYRRTNSCMNYSKSDELILADYVNINFINTKNLQISQKLTANNESYPQCVQKVTKFYSIGYYKSPFLSFIKLFQNKPISTHIFTNNKQVYSKIHINQRVIAAGKYNLWICDANQNKTIEIKAHNFWIPDIQAVDENKIITCSCDNTIKIWDLRNINQVVKEVQLTSRNFGLRYEQQSNSVLIGQQRGGVVKYELESGMLSEEMLYFSYIVAIEKWNKENIYGGCNSKLIISRFNIDYNSFEIENTTFDIDNIKIKEDEILISQTNNFLSKWKIDQND